MEIYWRCVSREMIWSDLWIFVQQLRVIISAFCLIVMSLRIRNETFFAFASLAPNIQVPHTSTYCHSKSRMNEWMWRNVSASAGRGGVGMGGYNLESGRARVRGRGQRTSHTRLGVCVIEKDCGKGEKWVDAGCIVQAKWTIISMVLRGPMMQSSAVQ